MLRELTIRNVAVVESVTVPFSAGLNVLTGETGAGKSILVDAVLLLAGARALTDVIRDGADSALVEGLFEIRRDTAAGEMLAEAGLTLEQDQVVIRRELTRAGRHRAFVNDSPVTVGLLQRLGDELLEVHGQHEHQRLLEPARRLDLLDRFAAADELRSRVADLHARYRVACAEVERLRAAERDRVQREDLLRFQLGELNAARLRAGEEEELRAERRRLQHAERFITTLGEATTLVDDDGDSALARLSRASRLLHELERLDPAFTAPATALDAAAIAVEEAVRDLRKLRERVVVEPGRLEAIDERLDALTRLRRKYGDTEAAMLAFRDAAAADLDRLTHGEELLAEGERAAAELRAELLAAAAALSERRHAVGRRLQEQALREIRGVGMPDADFRVVVARGGDEALSARGIDQVELTLSANAGEAPKALARVASGGELSRTMLALTVVIAGADGVPTLIFDEVDAGIGGPTASVVAEKLAAAAHDRQVLCVTHLAQIAARADHHLRVTKGVRGGRTRAAVAALRGPDRITEIARMLGGESRTALLHARELLGRGARRRAGAA